MTTKLLKAPLYAVSEEWERNGYNDSDFYRVMYDPNTDSLQTVETWTTRFACGHIAVVSEAYAKRHGLSGAVNFSYNPQTGSYDTRNGVQVSLPVAWFVPPSEVPERVWERAEELLRERIYQLLRAAEEQTIQKPSDAKQGQILRLSEAHRSVKAKTVLPAGTRIRVNECSAYGTFYRNGYNRPGRHNRSVVGTVVGRPDVLVRVPLAKCQLDVEPTPEAELRQRAAEVAAKRRFERSMVA